MAAGDFHVAGPTKIYIGGTEIGWTDNDDLVSIEVRDHYRNFTRLDLGAMIAESVLAGSTATISFTMVAWDNTALWTQLGLAREIAGATVANEGKSALVGSVASAHDLTLTIEPQRLGQTKYAFGSVILASGPEYIDFGNATKRIALSFTSLGATTFATTTTTAAP